MEQPDPLKPVRELIVLLRRPTLRTRVGVWRMPPGHVGRELDVAARLGIEAIDVRDVILERLPAGTRFVRLTSEKVLEALDAIASSSGKTDCALIFNVDLLLAGLKRDERQEVWRGLFDGMPYRSRALVVAVPETATELLPDDRLWAALEHDSRLVGSYSD